MHPSPSPYVAHALLLLSLLSWCDQPRNIWHKPQIMKLPIIQSTITLQTKFYTHTRLKAKLQLRPSCVTERVNVNQKWHSHQKQGISVIKRSQPTGAKTKNERAQINRCKLAKGVESKKMRKTRAEYILIFTRLDKNLTIQTLLRLGRLGQRKRGWSIISFEILHSEPRRAVFV